MDDQAFQNVKHLVQPRGQSGDLDSPRTTTASLVLGVLSKTIGKFHFEDGSRGFFYTVQKMGTEHRWEEGMVETWETLHLQLPSEHRAELREGSWAVCSPGRRHVGTLQMLGVKQDLQP